MAAGPCDFPLSTGSRVAGMPPHTCACMHARAPHVPKQRARHGGDSGCWPATSVHAPVLPADGPAHALALGRVQLLKVLAVLLRCVVKCGEGAAATCTGVFVSAAQQQRLSVNAHACCTAAGAHAFDSGRGCAAWHQAMRKYGAAVLPAAHPLLPPPLPRCHHTHRHAHQHHAPPARQTWSRHQHHAPPARQTWSRHPSSDWGGG
jgi:hypothetical protein